MTANAWAASNRTDGCIEAADLALIHAVDPKRASELAAAGLWERTPDGWLIVGFHKTQTTKSQLDALDHKRFMDRERKARERRRKRGESERESHDDEISSRVTSERTSDVTHRQGEDRQEQDRQGAPTGALHDPAIAATPWAMPDTGSCRELGAGGAPCGRLVSKAGDRYCRAHQAERTSS